MSWIKILLVLSIFRKFWNPWASFVWFQVQNLFPDFRSASKFSWYLFSSSPWHFPEKNLSHFNGIKSKTSWNNGGKILNMKYGLFASISSPQFGFSEASSAHSSNLFAVNSQYSNYLKINRPIFCQGISFLWPNHHCEAGCDQTAQWGRGSLYCYRRVEFVNYCSSY